MQGKARPDSDRCIEIVTRGALVEMILPGLLAIVVPLVIGFLIGPESLGGFLAGATATGVLMGIFMANAGAAWDNAKKWIEEGNLGGKGTEVHAASVIGDTVGDPLEDTAGPAMNILIKLMAVVSLVFAPLIM
jgi:K(+)-stimulated pyrophosphate-energized sodium pump